MHLITVGVLFGVAKVLVLEVFFKSDPFFTVIGVTLAETDEFFAAVTPPLASFVLACFCAISLLAASSSAFVGTTPKNIYIN